MKKVAVMMAMIALSCVVAFAQKQGKTLVAYFSATGTTEATAKLIAETTGGTLYEIEPEKTYTAADLNWHDKNSRSSVEMADPNVRPAVKKGNLPNLTEYKVIYIGFPIWWGVAPRVINTFIEANDLSGKTIIPFATSGGSGIDKAEKELRKAYPQLEWQAGMLLNNATKEEIMKQIKK